MATTDTSAADAFSQVMEEFLRNLTSVFPEQKGPAAALAMLELAGEASNVAMASAWHSFTLPIVDAIRNRDAEVVGRAFEESKYQMIRQIKASEIIAPSVDKATRASVWKYMDSLTSLSQLAVAGTPVLAAAEPPKALPVTPVPAPVAAPPVAAPPVAAPPVAAPPVTTPTPAAMPPKPADMLRGITSAIPEIFKSINDVLKQDENGPLSSLIRGMMQPNQLQTGFAGNIAANMNSEPDQAVMEQVSAETGLTAAMINEKLRKLELYEKRRKSTKKH
jgi:hypothetical protein